MRLPIHSFIDIVISAVGNAETIVNLDPDFSMPLDSPVVLKGLNEIYERLWRYTVFSDIDVPIRLVLNDSLN